MYDHSFWAKGGGPIVFAGISAIEQALWDIKGKALDVPVYELLGGKLRERIRSYSNGWSYQCETADDFARAAEQHRGRRVHRLQDLSTCDAQRARRDPARHPPLGGPRVRGVRVQKVAAVRRAVGPDADLMVDLSGGLTTGETIRFCRRLEELDLLFIEEPADPFDLGALRKIAEHVHTPIALGERVYTRYGFRPILESRAADVLQPDIGNTGGISETRKIAAMAEAYNMQIQPHVCASPVSTAAALQLDACITECAHPGALPVPVTGALRARRPCARARRAGRCAEHPGSTGAGGAARGRAGAPVPVGRVRQSMTAVSPLLDDNSTPAVLLGCFKHGGVGVVRSLGRLGVPVHCIDAEPTAPAFSSKYCRERLVWDLHSASENEALRFLERLGRRIGRPSVLITTSDIGAMFVADQADTLREWFLFPEVDADLVRSLCSKRQMHLVAHEHGVDTPETAFPASRDEVLGYLETARFPVLLKPIYSYLPGRAPQRLLLVHSAAELLEHYDANDDVANGNLMFQEFVPGGNDQTYTFNGYFDRQGRCALAFTGRKLRNFPGEFGQGSLGECMKVDQVETTTVRFMEEIGYRGCLDLGYRYDAVTASSRSTTSTPALVRCSGCSSARTAWTSCGRCTRT